MPELKKMPTKEELKKGVENDDCLMILDYYPDFQVIAEYDSATYYYIDYRDDEVCIVDAIASLVYDMSRIDVEPDGFELADLFDCDVSGERETSDDNIIYMWFKRRRDN